MAQVMDKEKDEREAFEILDKISGISNIKRAFESQQKSDYEDDRPVFGKHGAKNYAELKG